MELRGWSLYNRGWVFILLTVLSIKIAFGSGMAPLPIRLVGGSSQSEGRVEVLYNNTWGTICDDFFGETDGSVICRQLNFTGIIANTTLFGSGMGPIWLDDVDCNGTESSIDQCESRPIGQSNCRHHEDIGVICDTTNPGEDGAIRLADGMNQSEGRVEIFHNGEWGTVCNDDWDLNDANVACRQLGYTGVSSWSARSARPSGSRSGFGLVIWLTRLQCSGQEERLDQCSHGGWGDTSLCSHRIHDVYIVCQGLPTPTATVTTVSSIDIVISSSSLVGGEKLTTSTILSSVVGGVTYTAVDKDVTMVSLPAMETTLTPSSSPTVVLNPGSQTTLSLAVIVPVALVVGPLFLVAMVTTIGGVVFYFRRKKHKASFEVDNADRHANNQDPDDRSSQESIFTNTSVTISTSDIQEHLVAK